MFDKVVQKIEVIMGGQNLILVLFLPNTFEHHAKERACPSVGVPK
jgi:hypothetical protein